MCYFYSLLEVMLKERIRNHRRSPLRVREGDGHAALDGNQDRIA